MKKLLPFILCLGVASAVAAPPPTGNNKSIEVNANGVVVSASLPQGKADYPTGTLMVNGVEVSGVLSGFTGGSYAHRDLVHLIGESSDALIESLTAGNTAQNLFSTRTPPSTFTRSTTWFGKDMDWTPLSVYNSTGSYSASLISPRHIIMAYHVALANGTTLYFASANGTVSTRTISSQARIGSTDIAIGYLSSDVPSGINFFKVLKSTSTAAVTDGALTGAPLVYPDRNYKAYVADSVVGAVFEAPSDSHRLSFYSALANGDSSSPIGVIVDGSFALIAMAHFADGAGIGDTMYRNYDAINTAMTNLGGSYQLTPITVTPPPSSFPFPVTGQSLDLIGASDSRITINPGDGNEGIAVQNNAGDGTFSLDTESGSIQSASLVGGGIVTAGSNGVLGKTALTALQTIRRNSGNTAFEAVTLGSLATVTPGTGIATALAVNVGSAGAPVLFNGALGTPSSGSGANLTSLNASNLASGTVPSARLGSGGAGGGTKFLADDQTFKTVSGGGSGTIESTEAILKGDGAGNAVAVEEGVDVITPSGTPALGKIIRATSSTAAKWEYPSVHLQNITADRTLDGGDTFEAFDSLVDITAACTVTLPPVAPKMSVTFRVFGNVTVSVKPNASDLIILDGVTQADGEKITSTHATGDEAVCTYYDATGWSCTTNGWTNGG